MLHAQQDSHPHTTHTPQNQSGDEALTHLFKTKRRTFSAEIIPPRNGSDTNSVLNQINALNAAKVDFISVTKGAGGSLRGGTLPIAQLIKQRFQMGSLAHFTCRDYTIEEIENALVDHFYFGIRNILALRGDPPDGKPDHFKPAPNRHLYAYELAKQISALNRGEYLLRDGYDSSQAEQGYKRGVATNFCIGVAAYPEDAPHSKAVDFFKLKVDAGADFAITQMLFSTDPYKQFIESIAKAHAEVPVLPGVRVLTNAAAAKRMVTKFGVSVPQTLIEALEAASSKEDAKKVGLDFATKLCTELLNAGAPGVHVFVMNDEHTGCSLIDRIRS